MCGVPGMEPGSGVAATGSVLDSGHWPEHPWLSHQFRRSLGETQEGGGSVSEIFLAASRMIPGDLIDQRALLKTRWNSLL